MSKRFLYKELTYNIIGAAMEVHTILGAGFLESVYEMALAIEFEQREIPYQRQADLTIHYKDVAVGTFRADYLVDEKVVVELKASKDLTDVDQAQLLNYLKGTGYQVGLLLNFGSPSLQHKRRIL